MLKRTDIERLEKFKKEVEALKLRFPIVAIARMTQTDRGNVSAYLNGKKPIGDKFLEKFYQAFNITEKMSTGEEEQPHEKEAAERTDGSDNTIETLKRQNEFLQSMVLTTLQSIADRQKENQASILQSLTRLENKHLPEESLPGGNEDP